MSRTPHPIRTGRVATLLAVCILLSAPGNAQDLTRDPDLTAYLEQVAELTRNGRSLVQEHGKDYLIGEYQALIEAYPDFPKNIQLETAIGEIYEWDFSNRGEPPDVESAYAVYLGIIDRYDPSFEYTKLVYRRAANRAESIDPAAARDLYAGMMEAYPDDPVVQLESLYRLGALAEQNGDVSQALDLLDMVLGFDARNQPINPDQEERIQTLQSQAASLMLALGIDPAATPAERLAVLDQFLEDHPEMLDEHGEIVDDFQEAMNRLKDSAPRDEVREAMAELQRLLAERQEARAMVDAPLDGESSPPHGSVGGLAEDGFSGTADPGGVPPRAMDETAMGASTSARAEDAFGTLDSDLYSDPNRNPVSPRASRAAAIAAAIVCSLLAAGGLFALRKRLGL